jgi:uncharacterized protein YkwD
MDVPTPPLGSEASALRKKKAKWRLISIGLGVVFLIAAYWSFERSFSLPLRQIASFEYQVTAQVDENFSAPSSSIEQISGNGVKPSNTLTTKGVIAGTNAQRAANGGLPALVENPTLDDIAMLRLDDMFQNQYFAHVAPPPDNESALTVASSVGYQYLALGENLALGNFAGNGGLIAAWMNSPGHRANILNTHYTQIGVAVREGVYQGQSTWIAVQIFGTPASSCPSPDAALKANLDSLESQITMMTTQLEQSKATIQGMEPQFGEDYNQAVANYNALAAQYNDLVAQEKTGITTYDAQVDAFNACLNS